MCSVDANKEDVGSPGALSPGPERAAFAGGPSSWKPSADWTAGRGPVDGFAHTWIPGGSGRHLRSVVGRAGLRGGGSRGPFRAATFQITEQLPPTCPGDFPIFFLHFSPCLPASFPGGISPSLKGSEPCPPQTGWGSYLQVPDLEAGAWTWPARWVDGEGGGYLIPEIDL